MCWRDTAGREGADAAARCFPATSPAGRRERARSHQYTAVCRAHHQLVSRSLHREERERLRGRLARQALELVHAAAQA